MDISNFALAERGLTKADTAADMVQLRYLFCKHNKNFNWRELKLII